MTPSDAVASLRPRPSGPPLRGRAPQSDGIIKRRLFAAQDTNQTDADSTLNSPGRGSRLGVGVFSCLKSITLLPIMLEKHRLIVKFKLIARGLYVYLVKTFI